MENRTLVQAGLKQLNRAHRPDVYALLQVAGIEPGSVNATSIGFGLGPRINAAGRLASAMVAYDLLIAGMPQAGQLAQQLQELNVQRQELTMRAVEVARERVLVEVDDGLPLIFVANEDFRSGIVGLVAGRLCEEFYVPAVVVEMGEEESRGSCRSIPEFNITHALDKCADLLVRHGGHAQAAGFTVPNENLSRLRDQLVALAGESLRGKDLRPTLNIDAEVPFDEITMSLADALRMLEPVGANNEAPVFVTRRLYVADYRRVGDEGRHLKLRLSNGFHQIDAIGFKLGEWAQRIPQYVDVAYHLEINEWNGSRKLQMNIQDLHPAGQGDQF
jgi:single-stranded-DNA-specific exonuclease